jgi:predicted metal-dependent peptidase
MMEGGRGGEESDIEEAKEKVDEAIRKAIKEVEKDPAVEYKGEKGFGLTGKEPDSIVKYVLKATSIVFDFRSVLRETIYDALGEKVNWGYPHILSHVVGEYLPSLNNRKKNVVIVIDISGSISDAKAKQFIGIVEKILKRRSDAEGWIIQCDEHILSCEKIRSNFKAKEMEIRRGVGGTSFKPPFRLVEQKRLNPRILIYLTDGNGELPDKKPPYPVVWILHKEDEVYAKNLKPYGKVLFYGDKDLEGGMNG